MWIACHLEIWVNHIHGHLRQCWQLHLPHEESFNYFIHWFKIRQKLYPWYITIWWVFFWDTENKNHHNYNIKVFFFSFLSCGEGIYVKASILQICFIQALSVFLRLSQAFAKCLPGLELTTFLFQLTMLLGYRPTSLGLAKNKTITYTTKWKQEP